jgi:hypothetical protein
MFPTAEKNCCERYTAPLSMTLKSRKEFITLLTLENLLDAKMKE